MTALDILHDNGGDLAAEARMAAAWSVLERTAKDEYTRIRSGPLADRLAEAAELTGSDGFTSKIDGVGKVILTAPTPKPKVTDPKAFADWCESTGRNDMFRRSRRVDVVDHEVAAEAITRLSQDGALDGWTDVLDHLVRSVEVREEVHVVPDAIDLMPESAKVTADGVWCTETGERVPGTDVTVAAQRVQLRVDKDARQRVTGQLRAALGMGGGA